MKAPANAVGKTFKCVKCGAHITVGAAPPAADPPAESAAVPAAQEPIGQILVASGCITPTQLDEALGLQRRDGGKTFEILIALGYLAKERLHEILSKQHGVATIDITRVTIDRELTTLIPRELAIKHLLLPIDRLGKLLTVAMACPLDAATIAEMEKLTGLKVKAMLCKYDDIQAAVNKQYGEEKDQKGAMHTFQLPPGMDLAPKDDTTAKLHRLEDVLYDNETLEQIIATFKEGITAANALEAIAKDPGFVAALLRTANSAAYGLPGQVDGIAMALALVGRDGVAALAQHCKKANAAPPKDLSPLYERSRRAARNAAALARVTTRAGRDAAYTAALLHSLGSIALATLAAQKYARIDLEVPAEDRAKAESSLLGIAFPEAGAQLAKRWRFPEALQEALRAQLDPESAGKHRELAALVAVACGPDEELPERAAVRADSLARGFKEDDAALAALQAKAL